MINNLTKETKQNSGKSLNNTLKSYYTTNQSKMQALSLSLSNRLKKSNAFTIVELLIVVVVIAILAAITIVSYNGITRSAKEATLKSDLRSAATQLEIARTTTNSYPENKNNLKFSKDTELTYTSTTNTYCLSATTTSLPDKTFHITEAGTIQDGECPLSPVLAGDYIQTVTPDRCPTERTMVRDARDNHTYFIQQLADGKCWMLTNLAYAGGTSNGGTNTYNDTIPTGDGTNGTLNNGIADTATTYTAAKYYIHQDANPTIHPNTPSTNNTGGGSSEAGQRQYGYLYNWCAAMGAQTSTSACANSTTPAPNTNISVCPAGWRLPTGVATTGEFTQLTTAIGATNNAAGSTILRSTWLAQLGGGWDGGFNVQGSYGSYWSASQGSAASARLLDFYSSGVNPSIGYDKIGGRSVRCLAS